MNVLFLSRLKIRTKGREGEISVDCVTCCSILLFLRVQLNAAGLTAWYWLLPFQATAGTFSLPFHVSGPLTIASVRVVWRSWLCIRETMCSSQFGQQLRILLRLPPPLPQIVFLSLSSLFYLS